MITQGRTRVTARRAERADERRGQGGPPATDRRAASSRSTSSRSCCGSSPPGSSPLIVYLTALERVRDFAVLKATGTSNATLVRRARAPGRRALAGLRGRRDRHRAAPRAVLPVPDRDRRVGVRAARGRRRRRRDRSRASPGFAGAIGVDPAHRVRGRVMPDLRVRDLTMEYASGGYKVRPIDSLDLDVATGRARAAARRERLRQDDAALDARATARPPPQGTITFGDIDVTASAGHDARRLPAQDGRHRVPGVQPDPEPHRARERPDRGAVGQGPDARGARRAPKSCSSRSGSRTG